MSAWPDGFLRAFVYPDARRINADTQRMSTGRCEWEWNK
jgi:hypothetical protein